VSKRLLEFDGIIVECTGIASKGFREEGEGGGGVELKPIPNP